LGNNPVKKLNIASRKVNSSVIQSFKKNILGAIEKDSSLERFSQGQVRKISINKPTSISNSLLLNAPTSVTVVED
jgi:hypothetical protein